VWTGASGAAWHLSLWAENGWKQAFLWNFPLDFRQKGA
jgi:hypothetical protein